jgi:ligand-binding sensor domain-containing protein
MRKPALAVVAVAVGLSLSAAGFVALHARHVLKESRDRVADEGRFAFDFGPLASIQNAGFEPFDAPSGYQAGAVFQGKLYLAGPEGLAELTSLDSPAKRFRVGIELPPAPVVRLAIGTLRGDSGPRLVLATSGEGVLWFDGRGFRQLRPRSAAARDITALLPLASGDLLIGTRQLGLLRFDGKTLTIFHPALADLNITALAGDEGDFWIGTRDRGALHWRGGQIDSFDGASGADSGDLPDPQVEAIVLAPGKAYVGTPMGVEEFEAQDGRARPSRTLAAGLFAHALALDGDTLTIATIDQGIREVALAPKRALPTARSRDADAVEAESFLLESGIVAIGPRGVFRRMPSGEWSRVLEAASSKLADRNIAALGFAPDGRLWIGYFDRGLDILSLGSQARAEHVEDDHVFCVNRIVADPDRNTMDVATANGLALFDAAGRERQILLRRDGLIADQVTDVFAERGRTVVATPAGLTFIDAGGMRSIYAFHGLVNNHVYALARGPRANEMLAGTLGGISLVGLRGRTQDGGPQSVLRNLTAANSGLKRNWTTAIAAVDDGWFVGTYGGGILRLDSAGHFTAMDGVGSPIEINPNAMLATARHVFAGSLGDGLLAYDRASQRWSRVSAGLPSRNVTALAERDGQIYVGTDNGAVRIAEDRMPQ